MPRITTSIVANNDLMSLTLFLGIAMASLESRIMAGFWLCLAPGEDIQEERFFYDPSLF